jgi:Ankyrin repeats (3 copies)
LLERQACPHARPRLFRIVLSARTHAPRGAGSGCPDTVDMLVRVGCDVGAADGRGWAPLFHAAASGHSEAVAKLLDAGADACALDPTGRTPLHWAAELGHLEAASLLVDWMLDAKPEGVHAQVRARTLRRNTSGTDGQTQQRLLSCGCFGL